VELFDRIGGAIPEWLAWPLSAASVVAAAGGAGLVFAAAAFGSVSSLVAAVACFIMAGILWYAADYAQGNREPV
jgi:hypothetical protein